jgi:diguanylate cyclase (GGDEF)-like protein
VELESDRFSWQEILGLREPRDGEWRLVRAAQLRELSKSSLLPMVAVVLAAASVATQFWGTVPTPMMLAWLGLLLITSLSISDARQENLKRKNGASRRDIAKAVTHSAILGLFWSVPPLFFAEHATPDQILMIAAFSLALLGAAALMLTSVPLAAIAMITLISTSLSIMLLRLELIVLASLTFSYGLCLAYTALQNGAALIGRLRNDLTLTEHREVVSLLLKEKASDGDWLWQIDARKYIVDPSPRFVGAIGISPEQLEGTPFIELLAGKGWEEGEVSQEVRLLISMLQRGQNFSEHLMPVSINNEQRWWNISGTPKLSTDRHVIGYRGVIADVTERRASERRTHRMAHFDSLTGLANRDHITSLLHQEISTATHDDLRCAFLLIDLDRFKTINDTLGHPVGDRLLEQVAKRLGELARPGDSCGRLGGDEFAMIIGNTRSSTELDYRAREVIEVLSRPYQVADNLLHIGASVGSAMFPNDGRSSTALLRKADLALYQAKQSGRGLHAPYAPALLQKAEERQAIETALRGAIKNGEFALAYQPVTTLATQEIAGFEALIRWTSPTLGAVPPNKFIPIAEESRLIESIGEWVLRTAMADAVTWPDQYRLAVNLSAGQLRDPRLSTVVLSALSQSGLDPHRLELETTEAVLGTDSEQAIKTIEQLNGLGVTFALDDFGTGYSTLSFIGRVRFNSIKIDGSFIDTAETGSRASIAVIRAVIAMADSLGIATIAEGIENHEQFRLAERLGVAQAQGFYLDKSMDASEVIELVDDQQGEARA